MSAERCAVRPRASVATAMPALKGLVVVLTLLATAACNEADPIGEVLPPDGTPTRTGEPLTIAAAGDICEEGELVSGCAATAALVEEEEPDLVLALGDSQYENGKLRDFEEFYDANWGRFKDITLPAPGNHDKYGRSGYDEYFGKPQHYMTDLGDWRVLSVDSNSVDEGEEFIEEELPSDDTEIVFWHHARYSSGTDHGSINAVDPLWDAARDGGACLVLYAHDHLYERGVTDGVAWFLVGTGGAEQHDDFIEQEPVDGSEKAIAEEIGLLFVTLEPNAAYTFEFVSTDGDVLDSGSGECAS
jgi:calcineurin-like phosphoesterase family protein